MNHNLWYLNIYFDCYSSGKEEKKADNATKEADGKGKDASAGSDHADKNGTKADATTTTTATTSKDDTTEKDSEEEEEEDSSEKDEKGKGDKKKDYAEEDDDDNGEHDGDDGEMKKNKLENRGSTNFDYYIKRLLLVYQKRSKS